MISRKAYSILIIVFVSFFIDFFINTYNPPSTNLQLHCFLPDLYKAFNVFKMLSSSKKHLAKLNKSYWLKVSSPCSAFL